MSVTVCNKADCTVAETGTCLELYKSIIECPFYKGDAGKQDTFVHDTIEANEGSSQTVGRNVSRTFHSGYELGTQDAAEIMRANYTHFIGILGLYNAGKTCLISSLYSLAAKGELLPKYLFAGSLTLQGFENRLRLLRRWRRPSLPEQLVEHTRLLDPRSPALMHLALKEVSSGRDINLLVTDLPGEWSKELIEREETATRFEFLKRADGIFLVIDGPSLEGRHRHSHIQCSRILLERLADNVCIEKSVPLVLLVSKCDLLGMKQPEGIRAIEARANELGFNPTVMMTAAFSGKPAAVKNGTGILESIERVINLTPPFSKLQCKTNIRTNMQRSFHNFPELSRGSEN